MQTSRTFRKLAAAAQARYIDLGGQATHVFRFAAPLDLAYEYFLDVPAVFRLLPDALDCQGYGPERYRLIVGATDGHGHSMAAIFDLQLQIEPGRSIHILPASDGPHHNLSGLVFPGSLSADAIFHPAHGVTTVEYRVDIDMSIPVPGVLRLMPMSFLQALGEHSMEFKMTQMINGFTRNITADFHTWAAGVA